MPVNRNCMTYLLSYVLFSSRSVYNILPTGTFKYVLYVRHLDSHVSLIIGSYLLDADVVLGVDEGLGRGVRLGQSHHAGDV